jgi:hypothetical protein
MHRIYNCTKSLSANNEIQGGNRVLIPAWYRSAVVGAVEKERSAHRRICQAAALQADDKDQHHHQHVCFDVLLPFFALSFPCRHVE